MDNSTVNLNFEDVFYEARQGIDRASLFIGLIVNNKKKLSIDKWNIVDNFQLINKPNDKIQAFTEFEKFIIKNSLCEMIELFEVTLIKSFELLEIIIRTSIGLDFEEIDEAVKKFKKYNFPKKLKKIDNLLANKLSKQKDFWQAMQNIRNCITHNMSIVDTEKIIIQIPNFKTIIKGLQSGKEIEFPALGIIPNVFPNEGSKIILELVHTAQEFKKGDLISFDNEQITYLIWAMKHSLDILRKTLLDYIIVKNIPINNISPK